METVLFRLEGSTETVLLKLESSTETVFLRLERVGNRVCEQSQT